MNLTQPIRVLRKAEYTQGDDGTLTPAMTVLWNTFARVRSVRGQERSQSQQTEASADYQFWTHRNDAVTEDDILECRGRQFNIRYIHNDGPPAVYMMIEATRGVAV
jgi:SPP1 family predicted phage head-tail adaptor